MEVFIYSLNVNVSFTTLWSGCRMLAQSFSSKCIIIWMNEWIYWDISNLHKLRYFPVRDSDISPYIFSMKNKNLSIPLLYPNWRTLLSNLLTRETFCEKKKYIFLLSLTVRNIFHTDNWNKSFTKSINP